MSVVREFMEAGKFPVLDYVRLSKIPNLCVILENHKPKIMSDVSRQYYLCNIIYTGDNNETFAKVFDSAMKDIGEEWIETIAMYGVIGWVMKEVGVKYNGETDIDLILANKFFKSTRRDNAEYRCAWIDHMIIEIKKVLNQCP